ncbi:MAG: hypothetical protein COA70_13295, partial [Planctomycetota bacterium]
VHALATSADGRAIFADGSPQVWVIDPDHPEGYMKLRFKHTSAIDLEQEGIVAVTVTANGRALLGARDGGVAWTSKALRVVEERFPRESQRPPLALDADNGWVYVLRAGVLDRFAMPRKGEEDDTRPPAQTLRLQRAATCMVTAPGGMLVLAGPQSDDQLGRLWTVDAETLAWEPLALRERTLLEAAHSDDSGRKKPDFTQVRSKLTGPAISKVSVDAVISATPAFWVTRDTGAILERPSIAMEATDVLPADALFLGCGPAGLLHGFADFARARNLDAVLSLETYMGCGFGVCNACPVATNPDGPLGFWPYTRTCIEGPVFPLSSIQF